MLTRQESDDLYVQVMRDKDTPTLRKLALTDLYFLLSVCCRRRDLRTDFHFARCKEVQESPDGHLDLWFREAGKSSIITFGLTIQDILKDPEVTVGIFSHTRPIAKSFLSVLKREFEIVLGRGFDVHYGFCVNDFLYQKITSQKPNTLFLDKY
jgi:hypothetical protein